MDLVERAGLVRPGSRVPIVGNRLALVASGRTRTVSSVQALAQPEVRRIAIGDSAAVPAGVYTKAYLERIGLWNRLQPKLLPAGNVRAALAAVQNGAADAAFVYVTDARGVPGVRIVSVIEGADAPQLVYPACIVASTRRPDAAARFVAFLRTATALGVFEGYGFMPLRTP
jgi:molybdate transport system substrate-binding protein